MRTPSAWGQDRGAISLTHEGVWGWGSRGTLALGKKLATGLAFPGSRVTTPNVAQGSLSSASVGRKPLTAARSPLANRHRVG
jgi:hypothetical protein